MPDPHKRTRAVGLLAAWVGHLGTAAAYLTVGQVLDALLNSAPVSAGTWALGVTGVLVAGLAAWWASRSSSAAQGIDENALRERTVRHLLDLGPGSPERTGRGAFSTLLARERDNLDLLTS